ncbi:MAG: D-2-hydroxyacid dehydrogenase [Candidatus Marinimicrobia bacterium]|nr:D-2-hydroxyacid dehydrogenase [Candidatus Neomarinimicrobiota bacterium]
MPQTILLVTRTPGLEDAVRDKLTDGAELTRVHSDEQTAEPIKDTEVIVGDPDLVAPHLHLAQRLKWFQSTFAGVDAVFRRSSRRDYTLTRAAGLFGPSMAEYALAHILSRERQLPTLAASQIERRWNVVRYRRLADITIGLLGVGNIGLEVARVFKALGVTVWGLRNKRQPVENVDRIYTSGQLAELLAGSDYVINLLPGTPQTRDLLSGDTLRTCKKGSVFINLGRGDVIDEESLVRAVEKKWLAGAILDVFREEPLPSESPLWQIPGVIITPHVAALGFATEIADIFIANHERYRAGKPLLHQVDWKRGY